MALLVCALHLLTGVSMYDTALDESNYSADVWFPHSSLCSQLEGGLIFIMVFCYT